MTRLVYSNFASLIIAILVSISITGKLKAQGGNWPRSAGGDCECFRIGLSMGASLLSTWSQKEEFTPNRSGSPLLMMGSTDGSTWTSSLPWGFLIGADIEVRLGESWRMRIGETYARERVTSPAQMSATMDVVTSTGTKSGKVALANGVGVGDLMLTEITVEKRFNVLYSSLIPGTPRFSFLGSLAVGSPASSFLWSWDRQVISPSGATIDGIHSQDNASLTLSNERQTRMRLSVGPALTWEFPSGFALSAALLLNYQTPQLAGDETIQDNSDLQISGPVLVHLSMRDVQDWLTLRMRGSFSL
jgi:hypothetical protein